ncbi:MAG: LysR family transcriptional regulator [Gammaproteobacteria bacterium]|nr:LysR family transcriptional regulator [Gammaproteobacteria bacterium]
MKNPLARNFIRQLTLRQMQIFETVVRLESYTRAAEELHLSQPTVSMQVKKLSETIGQTLLEKTGKHLHTTVVGEEVYNSALDILSSVMSLEESTSVLESVIKGPLRIAVITSAKYFMPHLLGAFIQQHQLVEPKLKVTNRSRVLERLKSNQDDLLIMGKVPKELPVKSYPFVDNELVVVAHRNHPLIHCNNISLQQLQEERFLIREAGSGTRLAIDRLFAEQNLKIKPYMELGSSESIKQAVMAGLGISVLSKHNLRLELEHNHIAVLDVQGFPLFHRWYAVHLRDKKLPLAARTFLDFLLLQGKEMLRTAPESASDLH